MRETIKVKRQLSKLKRRDCIREESVPAAEGKEDVEDVTDENERVAKVGGM